MFLSICSSQLIKVLNYLERNRSTEIVGIGIGMISRDHARVRYIELCNNVANNPQYEFLADSTCFHKIYRIIKETGEDIVTIIHSHVAGDVKPSAKDLYGMKLWSIPWIILNSEGVYRAWILEYEGKPVPTRSLTVENC